MGTNLVKAIRLKQGLTQAALAKKAGTTQQQVQRIEAGQAARIDMAARISDALGVPLERAFPKARSAVRRVKDKPEEFRSGKGLKVLELALREAGIDSDPTQWFLKVQLLSGVRKVYAIDSGEKARLWSLLQDSGGVEFISFDGLDAQVAVRRDQLAYAHFLFEPPFTVVEQQDDHQGVELYLANSSKPLLLEMDPDPDASGEEDTGQLRGALFQLDLDPEPDDAVTLTDVDGETIFIRAAALALIQVPQALVLPDDGSGYDSDEEAGGAEREPEAEAPSE